MPRNKKKKAHCTNELAFTNVGLASVFYFDNIPIINNIDEEITKNGFSIVDSTPDYVHYVRHYDDRRNVLKKDHFVVIELGIGYAFIKSYTPNRTGIKSLVSLSPTEINLFKHKAKIMLKNKKECKRNGRTF